MKKEKTTPHPNPLMSGLDAMQTAVKIGEEGTEAVGRNAELALQGYLRFEHGWIRGMQQMIAPFVPKRDTRK